MAIKNSVDQWGATPFVVGQDGISPYSTIASAITAATATGGVVFIKEGTYVENLTLVDGVSLTSYDSIPSVGGTATGAVIDGTLTFEGSGQYSISNLSVINGGSAPCLSFTGSDAFTAFITNSVIIGDSVAAISDTTSVQCSVIIDSCTILAPASDYMSGTGGSLQLFNCTFFPAGGTNGIVYSSGGLEINNSLLNGGFVLTGGSFVTVNGCSVLGSSTVTSSGLLLNHCNIQSDTGDTITLTGSSGSVELIQSSVESSSGTCVNVSTPATLSMDQGSLNCSSTYAVTGTGFFNYGILELTGGANTLDPGLTISQIPILPFAASPPISTIAGDIGTITSSSVTIYADQASQGCGATVLFNNGENTSTLQVTDGSGNTLIGENAGGTGSAPSGANTALGQYALGQLSTDTYNVAVGYAAGYTGSGTSYNTSIGCYSMEENTTGSYNSTCGAFTMEYLQTGSNNTALGATSGSNYSGAESSNILINHPGVASENHTLHIGAGTGTDSFELQQVFIAGITGTTPVSGNTPQVTLCDSTGNLTVISSSSAGYVLTSNGSATPSFQAPVNNTWTDQPSSFSAVAGNGYFITQPLTATLPTAPSMGTMIQFVVITPSNSVVIQAGGSDIITVGNANSSAGGTATGTTQSGSALNGTTLTLVYESSISTWWAVNGLIGYWSLA